jgi:hypothetical protein
MEGSKILQKFAGSLCDIICEYAFLSVLMPVVLLLIACQQIDFRSPDFNFENNFAKVFSEARLSHGQS